MAGTTRLELATSAVTAAPERFYNNIQDRGDCQGPPKLLKIAQDAVFCGLGCGLEILRPKWRGLARHRPIDRRFKGDQTSTAWPKFLPRYQSRPKIGDLIRPGYNSNYGKRKKAAYIYL